MHLELLTAARQGEVVGMEWRHVDFKRGIWTIPKTKNGRPHEVMLSEQASELLRARKGLHDVYVFPLPNGTGAVASKAIGIQQYAAREELDIPTWTVHDLRRSAMTGLARLGCPRQIQDRIANHFDNSIAAIYDRHSYDQEAKKWLQIWADTLDRLCEKEKEKESTTTAKRVVRVRPKVNERRAFTSIRLVARRSGVV
jgi:integrase